MPPPAGRLKAAAAAVAAQQKAAADASDETPPIDAPDVDAASESQPTPPSNDLLDAVSAFKGPSGAKSKRASQKLRSAALALTLTSSTNIPWGDFDYLTTNATVDPASLSNEKLKRHLRARDELAEGTKQELIERLQHSLEEERQRRIAIELELEAKHRATADLEEAGAVYATGKNAAGQLGLGDLDDRHAFEVIPSTRGQNVQHVSVGGSLALATTESHAVYAWGSGPTGLANSHQTSIYKTPQLVSKLTGEEIITTAVGANHACAASEGGDLFVWGFGVAAGAEEDTAMTPQPKYVDTVAVSSIECGEMHTCVTTKEDEVYAFGHGANGRLGHGRSDSNHQPTPLPVRLPTLETVTLIACGSEHTLLCTRLALYSFGCGDGGRLGHGPDFSDRYEPCEIASLRGAHILSISAGTWHSACVVHVPPLDESGWLYTWGSGFQGQLGQGTVCKVSTPTLVQHFVEEGMSVKSIHCGPTHNAAITHDGNLYTWGSNKHGALGRAIDETMSFTSRPGVVAEFGTIVKRIGRGLPRSVALGREFTIIATHPYTGPTEEEANKLAEERRMHDEADRTKRAAQAQAEADERKRIEEVEAEKRKIEYLTSRRLCTMDRKCPGFTYETNQPSICRECGFSVVYHTIVAEEERP
ncbi:hypothetical protein ACHAXT_003417 [Thalassiosira profunda]